MLAQPVLGQDVSPPTRGELTPPTLGETVRPSTTLTIDGGMERAACALDDPQYAAIKLTLSSVTFDGAAEASDVDLTPSYSQYLGRELPVSVLCDIRAEAGRRLQSAGYLAIVEIPAQRLTDGNAQLKVVFGRLKGLRVRGEAGPSENLVASYLEPLVGDAPFNSHRAERHLLLADDLPGVDVRLSLRPAADGAPGDLMGEIAVVRRRGALQFNVQNFGSKALGRWGALLRGEMYDLTGLGDRTTLAAFSTLDFDEQQTLQAAHDFAIGGSGLRLGGGVTYSWTHPSLGLAGLDVRSQTLLANIGMTYPLQRSRRSSSRIGVGFDYVNQDVDLNDTVLISRDRVRAVYARFENAFVDSDSVSGANGFTAFEPRLRGSTMFEIRKGLDVFGATKDCRPNPVACILSDLAPARIEADPTPLLARGSAALDFRPLQSIRFSLTMTGQYTGEALPAFEEYAGGNYAIGRGYDPGTIIGDNGFGVAFEIGYGSLSPQAKRSLAISPYLFSDAAWVWNHDPSKAGTNPDHLWSVGGGLRWALGNMLQADVTLAVPLRGTNLDPVTPGPRVMFSLTTRLLPWSL